MQSATDNRRILMAGCGQLGRRIGLALARDEAGRPADVWGLKRSSSALPAPLKLLQADFLDRPGLAAVLPDALDVVIYCVSPAQYDDEGYRAAFVTGFDNLLDLLEQQANPPARVFFISSTAVYHQDDDSWVDEDSPTEPERFSGRRLLQAEQRMARSPLAGTAIRFSGIYGGRRRGLLERIRAGQVAADTDGPYGNRVHEDDCVGIIDHLVRRHYRGEALADCYLASDCEPVRQGEMATWLCRQIACAPPQPAAKPVRRAGSKRCDNRRLLDSGYRFKYPSFRDGYAAMLAEDNLATTSTPTAD